MLLVAPAQRIRQQRRVEAHAVKMGLNPDCRRYHASRAAASASGEFRLVSDAGQEARRVKAAACALVEPDVILSCRDRYDAATREAVSRLIAAALSNQSVSPSRVSRHAD